MPVAFHFFDVQRKQPQSVKKELAALVERGGIQSAEPGPRGNRCPELCEANHRRADQHDLRTHAYRACELRNWPPRQIFPPFPNRSFFLVLGLAGRSFCHRLRLSFPPWLASAHTLPYRAGPRKPRQTCGSARNRASFNLPAPGVAQALSAVPPISVDIIAEQDRRASAPCKKLTLEPKARRCEVGRRVGGRLKAEVPHGPRKTKPSLAVLHHDQIPRLSGKLMGRSVGPAIRHRLRPRRVRSGATLRSHIPT